jgi:hypothetical protein
MTEEQYTHPNFEALSENDRDSLRAVIAEIVAVLLGDGAAVLFTDTDGSGVMAVHMLGDQMGAASMLAAAPDVFNKVYGRPDGVPTQ